LVFIGEGREKRHGWTGRFSTPGWTLIFWHNRQWSMRLHSSSRTWHRISRSFREWKPPFSRLLVWWIYSKSYWVLNLWVGKLKLEVEK